MSVMCTACLHESRLVAEGIRGSAALATCQGGDGCANKLLALLVLSVDAANPTGQTRSTRHCASALGAPGECHDEVAEVVDVQPGARWHNRR